MRTRTNAICAACASAHDTLNRRYCLKLQRSVEADVLPLCEKWLPVPGFPLYVVGERSGRVLSRARGPWRERRAGTHGVFYLFDPERGLKAGIHGPRILFAARRGVNPTDEAFDGLCVTRDGRLMSRADFHSETNSNRWRYADMEKTLEEARRMADLLLDAIRDGDFSKISVELYRRKEKIIAYMADGGIAYNRSTAEELFSEAADHVLTLVREGRALPLLLDGYLRKAVRGIHARHVAERRKLRAAAQNGTLTLLKT